MSDKVERSLMAYLVKGLDKDNTEVLNLKLNGSQLGIIIKHYLQLNKV